VKRGGSGRRSTSARRIGLKHESSIHCDALVGLPKSMLTDFVASLTPLRMRALDLALCVALALA
jgi:mRNA interferase MazF